MFFDFLGILSQDPVFFDFLFFLLSSRFLQLHGFLALRPSASSLQCWSFGVQSCSFAVLPSPVLQPRPAVLELLLDMPCLPVVWQPCQGSREACSVEALAGEALKSCSGLSVQLLPSGLQF